MWCKNIFYRKDGNYIKMLLNYRWKIYDFNHKEYMYPLDRSRFYPLDDSGDFNTLFSSLLNKTKQWCNPSLREIINYMPNEAQINLLIKSIIVYSLNEIFNKSYKYDHYDMSCYFELPIDKKFILYTDRDYDVIDDFEICKEMQIEYLIARSIFYIVTKHFLEATILLENICKEINNDSSKNGYNEQYISAKFYISIIHFLKNRKFSAIETLDEIIEVISKEIEYEKNIENKIVYVDFKNILLNFYNYCLTK